MATLAETFRASLLKIERAKRHLHELEAASSAYISKKPLTLTWEEIDPNNTLPGSLASDQHYIGLVPRLVTPIPDDLAPIIGDVVHNLRSALNVMIFSLISEHVDEKDQKHIAFPFLKTQTSGHPAMGLLESSPSLANLVRAWEPFPEGRSRLYALHEMWNADKHRSIIPVIGGLEYSQGKALFGHSMGHENILDPFLMRKQIRDGRPYIVIESHLDAPPIGTEIACTIRLALDGSELIKGRDLLHELDAQCKTVAKVLESFVKGDPPNFLPASPPEPVEVQPGIWVPPPSMSRDDFEQWIIRKNQILFRRT